MSIHTNMNSKSHSQERSEKHKGKQNSGGEPTKHAIDLHAHEEEDRQSEIDISEGHDNKRGNIGPSGQGSHRGRETRNRQSKASGRSNVPSDTQQGAPH
jgi:hypothetical protein